VRTETKLKVLAFTVLVVIPGIVGAGKIREAAQAARARELAQVRIQAFAAAEANLKNAEAQAPPREEVLLSYEALPAEDLPISRKDQKCLGSLITTEAGDQSKLGKYAVGFTVLNRMKLNRSDLGGNTVCGVVTYKTTSKRHGVRWQYDGLRHPPKLLTEATIEDLDIAADILRGRVKPQGWLSRALYYKYPKYAKGEGGKWFDGLAPLGIIGVHHFFTENPRKTEPVYEASSEGNPRLKIAHR